MRLARARRHVHATATVGASSERRCQRARGFAVSARGTSWVVAATSSILELSAIGAMSCQLKAIGGRGRELLRT
jgi:hypothetical protein